MPQGKVHIPTIEASTWGVFISSVWEHGRAHARDDLPWRNIDDAYAVWVSEAMLQQTQVSRVCNYWPAWMSKFPTVDALSSAATYDVLDAWQGLGYNSRALRMKKAADICSQRYQGKMPQTYDDLIALPGIGPATAAGIMAFAYQRPSVYIETNVRTVFLHHFFSDAAEPVRDAQLAPLVERACDAHDPRGWYYALLDYGHYLKKTVPNPSRKAHAYKRQSAFEGSNRQKRAFIVRTVLGDPGIDRDAVWVLLNEAQRAAGRSSVDDADYEALVTALVSEGFFTQEGKRLVP